MLEESGEVFESNLDREAISTRSRTYETIDLLAKPTTFLLVSDKPTPSRNRIDDFKLQTESWQRPLKIFKKNPPVIVKGGGIIPPTFIT